MRIKGRLEKWNDERGFGFLKPMQGDRQVFVHISAFAMRSSRPQVGQLFVFEIEAAADGKVRAINVQLAGAAKHRREESHPPWGAATFLTIPAFIVLYLAVAMLWHVPMWASVIVNVVAFLLLFTPIIKVFRR